MLVLDCTTSLQNGFSSMKNAAKQFVRTLISSNGGGGGTTTTPTVTTTSVSDITSSSAKCGGNVTSDGGSSVTARGICWSTNQNPTTNNSHTSAGSGTGTFTANITGLSASTTYYVRAYATNSKGTSYGEQKTFTTTAGGGGGGGNTAPTVTTSDVTDIRENTAWCGGNVVDDGGATVTERGICWSTSSNPTISSNHVSSDSGLGSFTAKMTNLNAVTTYYVRAYAKNNVGIAYGEQKVFKTGIWLNYGTWEDCTNKWGVGQWAVMFPVSTIAQYNGSITKINAYCGMAGIYTLKIYKGGTTQPTTLLKSQSFNVTSEGWQWFTLSTPLALPNNTSLWVSLSCSYASGEYPAGSRDGEYNSNARWIVLDGSWVDIYDYNGYEDLSWAINTLISSSVKGEEGKEIQLPQTPVNQEYLKNINVSSIPVK